MTGKNRFTDTKIPLSDASSSGKPSNMNTYLRRISARGIKWVTTVKTVVACYKVNGGHCTLDLFAEWATTGTIGQQKTVLHKLGALHHWMTLDLRLAGRGSLFWVQSD